ncbi:MAG: hypothetical protein L0215_26565 [Gemmataceae bacterium]|nr:hypothetical protein [Gemmataceae bacterium]
MKAKKYWEMTAAELATATKHFDVEDIERQSRALTPEERKQWRRVRRKRGRPKSGKGFQRISVSIEKGLLKRVTAFAAKRQLTRSKLMALLLEDALANSK